MMYDECYAEHDWSKPENLEGDIWQVVCRRCGEVEQEFLFLEFWKRKTMTVCGKIYKALKAWGNIAKCMECGTIIFDAPLILWSQKDNSKAVTFCFICVKRLGILDKLMRKRKEK